MADASDQAAKENYDRFIRICEKAAIISFRLSKELLREAEQKAAEIKERVVEAADPAKAMQQEMDRATRAAKEQIEELRVNGLIDNVQARDINRTIDGMSKYYDLDDGCTKAATIDKFKDKCQEMERDFFKTRDKEPFKDLDKVADNFSKVPRAVYMDESRLHPTISQLKADIKIKEAVKAMEKTISMNKIKNGLDELVR